MKLFTLVLASFLMASVFAVDAEKEGNLRVRRRAAFDCPICGAGKVVTDLEAVPAIPGQPGRTCGDLLAANEKGNILEWHCPLLQYFTIPACGCESGSAAAAATDAPAAGGGDDDDDDDDSEAAESTEPNLVKVAKNHNYTLWVTALEATNLVHIMARSGPYTVLAPNDAAFSTLPDGLLQLLLQFDVNTLNEIVLYHVVNGLVPSKKLKDGKTLETLSGDSDLVSISKTDGVISFNEDMADLLEDRDLTAGNGVLHGISGVLLPPTLNMTNLTMFLSEMNMTHYMNVTTNVSRTNGDD